MRYGRVFYNFFQALKESEEISQTISDYNFDHLFVRMVESDSFELLELLLENGVVFSNLDYGLTQAASLGHLEIVELLLNHGANPKSGGNEALKSAVLKGHTRIVKLFLAQGIEFKLSDSFLEYVFQKENLEILSILTGAGFTIPNLQSLIEREEQIFLDSFKWSNSERESANFILEFPAFSH